MICSMGIKVSQASGMAPSRSADRDAPGCGDPALDADPLWRPDRDRQVLARRSERKHFRLPHQRLYVPMTRETPRVYDLTRSLYQVKQSWPQFQKVGAAEVRLVPSVSRRGGRYFEHPRPVGPQRLALHFIDQLAMTGHRVALFKAWLKDPNDHPAAPFDQHRRQLHSARGISVSPFQRPIAIHCLFATGMLCISFDPICTRHTSTEPSAVSRSHFV